MLRANIKEALVNTANKINNLEMLEAPFVVKSNDMFHRISEKVKQEVNYLDPKRIFDEWQNWLNREVKKNSFTQSDQLYQM